MDVSLITQETLPQFTYVNDSLLQGPIRAIVLTLHGLGFTGIKTKHDPFDEEMGAHGALSVFPSYGPWSWMNFTAIHAVDRIVSVLREKYGLAEDVPVISTGGSMGGLSAIVYSRYAAVTPVACAANCPVCDLLYHSTERPDLPRTLYAAFAHYDCGVELAMKMHSPLHLVPELPNIPYYIVQGTEDTAVNKQAHGDRMAEAMRKAGLDLCYHEVTGMGHTDFTGYPEEERAYIDFILRHIP
jgi:acetyl esterase/lipase